MMQLRDWIAGGIGAIIFLLGLLPMLGILAFLNDLPATALIWIVAIAALYLVYTAIVEITNSNIMGTATIVVAGVTFAIGLLPILHSFGIGPSWFEFNWLSRTIYNVIFVIEGFFLMIATFAMEL